MSKFSTAVGGRFCLLLTHGADGYFLCLARRSEGADSSAQEHLASSSARCPACDTHRPPLRLHTGRDTSCLFFFFFWLFVCFSKSSEWEADGSRRKDPGLLSWCDVMVSDACVHVVFNGASARSVNILSGAAQGAFRDALPLQTKLQAPVQQHRKIYVSLFVITNGCQKCKENVTFFFFFLHPLTGFCLS